MLDALNRPVESDPTDVGSAEALCLLSISGPNVYVAFQAQQGSAGADGDGVSTSRWGDVHTIYRDRSNDCANSVEQQASTGMSGGPGHGGAPGGGGPKN